MFLFHKWNQSMLQDDVHMHETVFVIRIDIMLDVETTIVHT